MRFKRLRKIHELQERLAIKTTRLDELNTWLGNHVGDPMFEKVAADRRALQVDIAGIEFKIEQIRLGNPPNGYGKGMKSVTVNGNNSSTTVSPKKTIK